ncbi:uncharacterized protein EDB93DRAFT_1253796 [Suillus bovinus]|uniref:uncharacterized protein n=1 Tax=Suillus bovinus TaxID=48563 RepID=UPI001B863EB3|nr:uncharacterized protein EDB93DRAFT_1253796 [Suillus bovinus]KAG2136936.1 hypothetical protein EDB93DRAFT_1253796 [Suillus bovinus]
MSEMIKPGNYRIGNVMYSQRYVCMSGNKEFVGHDVGEIIRVDVIDEVEHLATLFDTATNLYIGIDMMKSNVVGLEKPQVLQLSSIDGEKFEIHAQDVDDVWLLKDNGNWSWIRVEAAPATDNKYWKFEKVE